MTTSKVLSSTLRCSSCQFNLLNVFTSIAGLSLCPTKLSPKTRIQRIYPPSTRKFSALSSLRSESVVHDEGQKENRTEHELREIEVGAEDTPIPPSNSFVPWYLQVDSPQPISSTLSERQRLPELPTNSPPLLHPILEHISIDLGLDDLSILDLRNLEPPPALGGNLVMLLGTARSEKHLHVSADRFCRWLRTTHKLSPYADGLLGRNELKLKLRRKARRARLLGSVGSTERGTADDGIRTGWVCVNVGTIKEAAEVAQGSKEPDGLVGFGSQEGGVKLVVQMLTEEKREELDLEGLWGGTLARQQRKKARDAELELETSIEEEVGLAADHINGSKANPSPFVERSRDLPSITLKVQNRALHTSSRSQSTKAVTQEQLDYDGLDSSSLEPRLRLPDAAVPNEQDSHAGQDRSFGKSAQLLALQTYIKYLRGLPKEDAIDVLGDNARDFKSTSFLTTFYANIPLFPDIEHWNCRQQLMSYAICLGHPGYIKEDLMLLIHELQASFVQIPSSMLLQALEILIRSDNTPSDTAIIRELPTLSMAHMYMALEIIEDLSLRGYDVLTEEVFFHLYKATARVQYAGDSKNLLRIRNGAHLRLIQLMHKSSVHFTNPRHHLDILMTFAQAGDWDAYWRHWRGIARQMQPRSYLLYAFMFRDVAKTRHQAKCIDALRTWIPEMDREQPPVRLGGFLAETVMSCLQVAEPDVEKQVSEHSNEIGEWTRLWRQCFRAYQASRSNEEVLEQSLLATHPGHTSRPRARPDSNEHSSAVSA
ncbi:ATPase synthesis protein 25 mitochondrial [Lignoscripta atroalba]|nr:ATPase synthesis protein 25 mitochondrial [Lignoscripta atroalba]